MGDYDNLKIIDWTNKCDKDCYDNRQRFLILHHTEDNSVKATLAAFNARKVSSHYIVDQDGQIYRTVDDNKRAWHAGKSSWCIIDNGSNEINNINYSSIGIEIVNLGDVPFPQEQLDAVVDLSKVIIDKYDIDIPRILLLMQILLREEDLIRVVISSGKSFMLN